MCKAEGQQTDVSLGGARVVTAGVKPVPALTLHQLPGAQAGWDQFLQLHIGILRSLKQNLCCERSLQGPLGAQSMGSCARVSHKCQAPNCSPVWASLRSDLLQSRALLLIHIHPDSLY